MTSFLPSRVSDLVKQAERAGHSVLSPEIHPTTIRVSKLPDLRNAVTTTTYDARPQLRAVKKDTGSCDAEWAAKIHILLPPNTTARNGRGQVATFDQQHGKMNAKGKWEDYELQKSNLDSKVERDSAGRSWLVISWGGAVTIYNGAREMPFRVAPLDIEFVAREDSKETGTRSMSMRLRDLTRIKEELSSTVSCDRLSEWAWYYSFAMPPCTGRYKVRVEVNWSGKPPPYISLYGSDSGAPKGQVDAGAGMVEKTSEQDVGSAVGTHGTRIYEMGPSRDVPPGVHVVDLHVGGPDGKTPAGGTRWSDGIGHVSGPALTKNDGTIGVAVDVVCNQTTLTTVVLTYTAPNDDGGGGGGGGGGAGNQQESDEAGGDSEAQAHERMEEIQGGTDAAASDGAWPDDAGAYLRSGTRHSEGSHGSSWLGDLTDRGAASLDPASAVTGLSQREVAADGVIFAGRLSWTFLEAQVDPNGSSDARRAIETHRVAGDDIVRGIFDGRHRGFVPGPS